MNSMSKLDDKDNAPLVRVLGGLETNLVHGHSVEQKGGLKKNGGCLWVDMDWMKKVEKEDLRSQTLSI